MPISQTERYKTDPEFRARAKRQAVAWQNEEWRRSPLYRRIKYLRSRIYKIRKGMVKKPRTSVDAIQAEVLDLKTKIKAERAILRAGKPKRKQHNRIRRRGRTDAEIMRDKATFEANMQLCAYRKQAKAELVMLIDTWNKKWEPLIGKRRRNCKKGTRKRRDVFIRDSQKVGDNALSFQISVIKRGPCKCFWCFKHLPDGGTIDHIVPLAKGGHHISSNLCAACPDCNSEKRDTMPEQFSMTPALL